MTQKTESEEVDVTKSCPNNYILAINDTLNVIHGKWKLPIIGCLLNGIKHFSDFQRSIPKITPRMLSKELKELEINGVVSRTVYDSIPVTIEYTLTESGELFTQVLDKMVEWGLHHRATSIKNMD